MIDHAYSMQIHLEEISIFYQSFQRTKDQEPNSKTQQKRETKIILLDPKCGSKQQQTQAPLTYPHKKVLAQISKPNLSPNFKAKSNPKLVQHCSKLPSQ